jgi:ribosome-binding factor A
MVDRKLGPLCREVFRVLSQALPDPEDPLLGGVAVVDVQPAPDASRLMVLLQLEPGADPQAVRAQLIERRGQLRAEIAAAVQRKRTPELVFQLLPTAVGLREE